MSEEHIRIVKNNIKSYPDFPKPGINFRDIFAVYANPESANALNNILINYSKQLKWKIEAVIGLESRGFLIGPQIANTLNVPFIPIRKKGKLPGVVKSIGFELEYGSDEFEVQTDLLSTKLNVLVVDDLLATGGSLKAACSLVESLGSTVAECLVIMELMDLKGRDNIQTPVHSIIKY